MKVLINLQGMIFRNKKDAEEYYGDRFPTAILEYVEIDEDGDLVE